MHGRVDLLFSVAGLDLSAYGRLKVRATILGGTVSFTGTCNLADPVSNPGVEMRIRKGSAWEDVSASHTNGVSTEVSFEVDNPQDYARTIELYLIGTTAPYLHMSVRRTGGVPDINCSFAQVDSVQAELVP